MSLAKKKWEMCIKIMSNIYLRMYSKWNAEVQQCKTAITFAPT